MLARCHGRHVARAAVAVFVLACAASPAQARHARLRLRHHGDPVRAFRHPAIRPKAHIATNSLPALPQPWCGTETSTDTPSPLSNAPQIKVVYARGHGAPDNLINGLHYANLIQTDVDAIRQKVDTESGDTKSVRFDLGTTGCGSHPERYVDIISVELPNAASSYTEFDAIKSDLLPLLPVPDAGARVDYVVYADGINRGNNFIAGQADSPIDDSAGYGNAVNRGPNGDGRLVAFIYGFGTAQFNYPNSASVRQSSLLHELSHTQGAVQSSAPHSTGAGHCYDTHDIMCYDDGGPKYQTEPTPPCPTGADADISAALDCNQDDYFSPAPAPGSYLATHWNEYDSTFFCAVASCDSTIGSPTVVLSAPPTAFRRSPVTLTANVNGATVTHYEWDYNNDGDYDQDTGTTNSVTAPFTSNGPRTVRVRATTQDGVFGTGSATLTVSEPVRPTPDFSITSRTLVGQPVVFDASSTSDPSGVVTNYKWDFDGNGTVDFDGGISNSATTTYATPGARSVVLEIDYPLGTSMLTSTVNIGKPGPPAKPPKLTGAVVRLAKLLSSGLPLTATCGAGCSLSAQLTVSATTAKALHLPGKRGKAVTIGRLSRTLSSARTLKTSIRLTSAARRALKHARSFAVTLSASLKQALFSALTLKKTLTIRR